MRNSPTHHDVLQPRLDGHLFCSADVASEVIHPDELLWVSKPCPPHSTNIVSCRHPDRALFEQECLGLELCTKPIKNGATIPVEDILILTKDQFDMEPSLLPQTVGVRLRDILTRPPQYNSRSKQWSLPRDTRIDTTALQRRALTGKQVILFSTDLDAVIEPLWAHRHESRLIENIASMGFYAVTGLNFSLFLGECPYAQRLNMNRSLMYTYLLDQMGVTVIPHTYALNDSQRQALAAHIRSNPNCRTVTINTQLGRNPHSIAMLELSNTVELLLAKTNVKIIIHGRRPAQWKPEWDSRVVLANHAGLVTASIANGATQLVRQQPKKTALPDPRQLLLPLDIFTETNSSEQTDYLPRLSPAPH